MTVPSSEPTTGLTGKAIFYLIVVGFVAVYFLIAGTAYLFNGGYDDGGGYDNSTSDYPACSEIVQHPGTWEKAPCADGDDLIEVQDYPSWDRYHPFD